jgi:hypothetical protein
MKSATLSSLCLASFFLLHAAQTGNAKRVVPINAAQASEFKASDSVGVAILVGVGKYPPFSHLGQLRYPGADVESTAAALKAQRYSVVTLKDSDATRESVLNAISEAGGAMADELKAHKSLTIIFFFSGHGFAVNGDNYLATFDAGIKNLASSGLRVKDVEQALIRTGAARRVLWIDACRNEPGSKGVDESRSLVTLRAAAGTRALLSTEAGHMSYEDDGLKQGVFTYYLVKGLRGAAAKSDGLVTFQDLAAYVTSNVKQRSLANGNLQIPYEAGESSGDFLLARAGESASAPTATPDTATPEVRDPPPSTDASSLGELQAKLDTYRRRVNQEKAFWAGRKPTIGSFRPEIQSALDSLDDNLKKVEIALGHRDQSVASSALKELDEDLDSLRSFRGAR